MVTGHVEFHGTAGLTHCALQVPRRRHGRAIHRRDDIPGPHVGRSRRRVVLHAHHEHTAAHAEVRGQLVTNVLHPDAKPTRPQTNVHIDVWELEVAHVGCQPPQVAPSIDAAGILGS